jgi:dolichyl-phosphate-mannose--protein O-mannosyl transferase
MTFSTAAKNFVVLITVAILLLIVDLIKWQSGGTTWSEAIWEVNQHSLSFALGVGIVLGHCFTVPKGISK